MLTLKTRIVPITLAALMALFLFAMPASAQDAQRKYQDQRQNQQRQQQYQPERQQGQGTPNPAADYDEATLDGVAQAYVEVTEIRNELQEALIDAGDAENARELQEAAGEKMVQAVVDNGLDVQTYNRVMGELHSNEELRDKLQAKIEAKQ